MRPADARVNRRTPRALKLKRSPDAWGADAKAARWVEAARLVV